MDYYEEYERRRRARNEAWLQRHHRPVTAVLVVLALCLFILPWLYMPFWAALWVQVMGCMGLYLLGRAYTWAFHRQKPGSENSDQDSDQPQN